MHTMKDDSQERGCEDADKHCGTNAHNLQQRDEEEAEDGKSRLRRAQVAERYGCGGAGDDDAGVAESDESNKEADASANSGVEFVGNGCDETLTDAGEGQDKKDNSGEKDGTQSGLPGDVHAFDHGVGEVGIQPHTRSEGQRVVGKRSHKNAAKGRTETGSGGDGGEWHSGLTEDVRIDEDDVSHRDERREACENLSAPVGGVVGEAEVVLEASADGHQVRAPVRLAD